MTTATPVSTANIWQHLNQTATALPDANQADHLPTVPPHSPEWTAFQADAGRARPYQQHLAQSLGQIRNFIQAHATNGRQKKAALDMLADFTATRVNCRPANLSPLMVNENRRNLHLVACQLNNPVIALEKRLGIALALAEGLNVCKEGSSLNILDCATELVQSQQGFAGVLTRTKNELVDQHLLQLVKEQDASSLHPKRAQSLEIHHVQALKNHVAHRWGLTVVADRYASSAYQAQAGQMAEALLEKTITPAVLAATVAEKLAGSLVGLTSSSLKTGMPTELLKTELLGKALQAEFGQSIDLEQCLEFNEDYTQVKLKPASQLKRYVLQLSQQCGLIPANADIEEFMHSTGVPVQQALVEVASLQGPVARRSKAPSASWNAQFWFGTGVLPSSLHQDEHGRRKHAPHHPAVAHHLRA